MDLAAQPVEAPRRPRGRPPSRSWAFFTSITEPQKLPSAVCRHCNQLVHYHKKWAQARTHLMKCPQFLRLLDTLPPSDVPEWYLAEINRRQRQSLMLSGSQPAAFQPTQVLTQTAFQPTQMATQTPAFKMIQPVPVAAMMMTLPNRNNNVVAKSEVDIDKVEEQVAMHLFTTMPVDKLLDGKMELPFLLQALQACHKNASLPNKEKLMTQLLDRCYERVNTRVQEFFKAGLVPVTLSIEVVTGAEGEKLVNYIATLASSEKYPMLVESVQAPRTGDADANAEFAARDVARVMKKLSCPMAGCVIPCATVEGRQTRELLEKQFPAMYFHGCLRDALWALVRQLFTMNRGTDTERKHSVTLPFVQDLQQFALQCKDLAFFLPQQEEPSYLRDISNISENMVHVTARRRLKVDEAFVAILQAEPFLDVDNVLNRLFSSGGNSPGGYTRAPHPNLGHLQTQLVKSVRSPQFAEKLHKYLDVLRPLHVLLSSLSDDTNSTSLLLSEVYSCFSRLVQQFGSTASLQPEEKAALQALVREQQEYVGGVAHGLANLLDPVLLGEELPADLKTEVEQKLMSSLHGDGTPLSDSDKEALYTQFMDFKKSALNQKTNKADTLAFRALKERKKSPLQFWFAEGSKWPELQAIACRIFVMPVCVVRPARTASEAGETSSLLRQKTDLLTNDKLTYVRVNTRQLQLAEVEGSSLAVLVKKVPTENDAADITASMVV